MKKKPRFFWDTLYVKFSEYSNSLRMNRLEVVEIIKNVGLNNKQLNQIVEDAVSARINVVNEKSFKQSISKFINRLRLKFNKHHRTWERVIDNESNWLLSSVYEEKAVAVGPIDVGGRPRKE